MMTAVTDTSSSVNSIRQHVPLKKGTPYHFLINYSKYQQIAKYFWKLQIFVCIGRNKGTGGDQKNINSYPSLSITNSISTFTITPFSELDTENVHPNY